MTDLTSLTIAEAREGLASKSFTSLELTDAHLAAIEAARSLNAFILETPDQARAMARAVDAKIARGEGGPLAGIPLGIKDLFATRDVRTTACSKILGNFVPSYESTVTSQLWRDGAVMLGKLNMDEFAMGSSNETSRFGPVVNPWRREGSNTALVPGGSSGGSASAVAALLCMGATATDTGGYAGLADEVDLHTWKLLKGVALATVLGIGNSLAFGNTDSDLLKALRESTGQTTNRAGQRLVEKYLNAQPTLTVRPGWPLRVIVHKDIILRPYRASPIR